MRSFTREDSGASILIEYIFTITILSVLFTMIILYLGTTMTRSDRIVMSEELDITASIIANQLSHYSNELQLNDITLQSPNYAELTYLAATKVSERTFIVPRPYGNKQYSIKVEDLGSGRGRVTVTYLSDETINTVTTFSSPVPVEDNTIICNTYNIKVSMTSVGGTKYMKLEEV